MNGIFCILLRISLKFVPKGPIDSKLSLLQVMVCRRFGDKPLSEAILTQIADAYIYICGLGVNELTQVSIWYLLYSAVSERTIWMNARLLYVVVTIALGNGSSCVNSLNTKLLFHPILIYCQYDRDKLSVWIGNWRSSDVRMLWIISSVVGGYLHKSIISWSDVMSQQGCLVVVLELCWVGVVVLYTNI